MMMKIVPMSALQQMNVPLNLFDLFLFICLIQQTQRLTSKYSRAGLDSILNPL